MPDHDPSSAPDGPLSPDDAARLASAFRADHAAVRAQIARAVVGQDHVVDGVLLTLFTGGHCLLEGVPGIGKTLLVRSLARALSLSFGRVQFTPDLMPADITGTTVVREVEVAGRPGERERRFVFEPGPVFHQILLADEINRATPKTQSALLEAMAERAVTAGGETRPLPRPFFVMATQNPIEQEGTYPLPEAQLDRFAVKLLVGTPSRAELAEILRRTTGAVADDIEPTLDAGRILAHQRLVRLVAIAEPVQDYAIRLVLATHPGEGLATPMVERAVRVGASPRAAQSLVLGAKCRALLNERPAASVDDIRAIARDVLRHRLILTFEAQAEGITPDAIIENLIATLPGATG